MVAPLVVGHNISPIRLYEWCSELGGHVVHGTEGVLLHDDRSWMHNTIYHSVPTDDANSTADTAAHPTNHLRSTW